MNASHILDMLVQEIAVQLRASQVFGTGDATEAVFASTRAIERLSHVPFSAWVKEGQGFAFLDSFRLAVLVPPDCNSDFDDRFVSLGIDMKVDTGFTGVIDEEEIAVQFNALGLRDLDTRIALGVSDGHWWTLKAANKLSDIEVFRCNCI